MRAARTSTLIRLIAAAVAVLAVVAFVVALSADALDRADKMAGVGSLVIAVVALVVAMRTPKNVSDQDRAGAVADALAASLRNNWLQEARSRGLFDPVPVRLRWRSTDRRVEAPAPSILQGTVGGNPKRITLSGDLAAVSRSFARLPRKRLVVIGEPGSGKTSLAVLLLIDLIEQRESGDPVPVLVSMSSWHPDEQAVDEWLVRQLAEESYAGDTRVPRALLDAGSLLPILDGFDEMPVSARGTAIRHLARRLGPAQGFVLTSRVAEYEDAVTQANSFLDGAAVVELEPVRPADAIAYLRQVNLVRAAPLATVVDALRDDPAGQTATAFTSPLVITLARDAYLDRDTEAPDFTTFDSATSIREWLVDSVITDRRERRRFAFLARHLTSQQTTLLTWWQLHTAVPRIVFAVAYGLIGALCSIIAFITVPETGIAWQLQTAALIGTVIGAITYRFPAAAPARINWNLRARLPYAFRHLRGGLVYGIVLGVGVAVATAAGNGPPAILKDCTLASCDLVNDLATWELCALIMIYYGVPSTVIVFLPISLVTGMTRGVRTALLTILKFGLPALLITGGGLALHALRSHDEMLRSTVKIAEDYRLLNIVFGEPVSIGLARMITDDPGDQLIWRHVLAYVPSSIAVVAIIGFAYGLVAALRDATGADLDVSRTPNPDAAWRAEAASVAARFVVSFVTFTGLIAMLQFVADDGNIRWWIVLPVAFGTSALTASFSAGCRFMITSLALWVSGRLPLNILGFLRAGRRKGILRISGTAYQFRHELLQNRLSKERV